MNFLKKTLIIFLKTVASVVLIALTAIFATSVSPVYIFESPKPFTGPDIFNPYRNLDTTYCWKRANFHTHTRVEGIFNECEYWPGEVHDALEKFGYDIVTFSNHNALTEHPFDSSLQVDVYEHGYNLFKFHKLIFGSDKVNRFDHLLPIFTFQKQFQFDLLGKDSDFIQFNHPLRTNGTSKGQMERLSGYRIMELDSGRSTENEYWDWALSAGHYSFGLANDDLHYPDISYRIAVRCNFLCTPTATYEDIKKTLLEGCYYSMRIPDYGNGDWEAKYAGNRDLPYIKDIGIEGETIHMHLSENADSIKVIGQNHTILDHASDTSEIQYTMSPSDNYARLIAYFPDGEVIYSNPFARYDASVGSHPFNGPGHSVSIVLTTLYNLLIALLIFSTISLLIKLLRK